MKAENDRRLLVVCGETSGDAHAAGILDNLKSLNPEVAWKVYGSGGRKLKEAGAEIMLHVSRLSAIGPGAALGNLGNYLKLRKSILKRIAAEPPDLAVLVDFPDFNLPLARKLKKAGIPVCYFISPQLWAWRKSRIRQIRKYVDLMLVIFPFEESFYRENGVQAVYVGNPTAARLAGTVEKAASSRNGSPSRPSVALLPGSRVKEVEQILPVMLRGAEFVSRDRDIKFQVFQAPEIEREFLEGIIRPFMIGNSLEIEVVESDPELLASSDCAMVKSGTSTLETLLLEVPFAMVYRLPRLSYLLLRPFVRTRTFCLANLVAEQRLVPEFIQGDATGKALGTYIKDLLDDGEKQAVQRKAFRAVAERLGSGDADRRAAEVIVETFFKPSGI